MDLSMIQQMAWQIAEDKGLHAALGAGVPLGPREMALITLAQPFHDVAQIAQFIKRYGMPTDIPGKLEVDALFAQAHTTLAKVRSMCWSASTDYSPDTILLSTVFRLVLVQTEISEACEVVDAREALGEELADAVIRLADLAETRGIDLQQAVIKKMEVNAARPYAYGTPDEQKEAPV